MHPTLLVGCVVAMLGLPGAAPAPTPGELERRAAEHPDGRFGLALVEWSSRAGAAVDDLDRCSRASRRGCIGVAREALRVAQEAATFAASAEVSPRLEPVRYAAEAGFRLMSTGLANVVRWYATYQRDLLGRGGRQVQEAGELLLGALGAAERVVAVIAFALPPLTQVQRDVDGFVASLKAKGVSAQDVLITLVVPDDREKDVAKAWARGETGGDDDRSRWRLHLRYRKHGELWQLERLEPSWR